MCWVLFLELLEGLGAGSGRAAFRAVCHILAAQLWQAWIGSCCCCAGRRSSAGRSLWYFPSRVVTVEAAMAVSRVDTVVADTAMVVVVAATEVVATECRPSVWKHRKATVAVVRSCLAVVRLLSALLNKVLPLLQALGSLEGLRKPASFGLQSVGRVAGSRRAPLLSSSLRSAPLARARTSASRVVMAAPVARPSMSASLSFRL